MRAFSVNTRVSTLISAPFDQVSLLILEGHSQATWTKSVHVVYGPTQSARLVNTRVSTLISAPFDQVSLLILEGHSQATWTESVYVVYGPTQSARLVNTRVSTLGCKHLKLQNFSFFKRCEKKIIIGKNLCSYRCIFVRYLYFPDFHKIWETNNHDIYIPLFSRDLIR